jgi:hypothetical protein
MLTTRLYRIFLLTGAAVALANPLSAQGTADPWESWETNDPEFATPLSSAEQEVSVLASESKQRVGENLAITARSDTSDAAYGPIPSRIQVESGISGETVKLTLGSSVSEWDDFQELSYSISLTAPFEKDEQRGSFITQTGLPDAFAAELAISGSIVSPKDQADFAAPSAVDLVNLGGPSRMKCLTDDKTPVDQRVKACNSLSFSALIEKYGSEADKEKVKDLFASITERMAAQEYVGWQIAGSVGRESFDHRDPVTLATIDEDRTVFSLSSSVTYVPRLDGPFAYVMGAEVEREFELPSAETRCPSDAGGEPTVTCFNASFGPPERETASTIFASIRYTDINNPLPIGGELRLAINPESGDWGAELPIYFLRSKDGRLNGGARLAYDSKQDDGFIGLFVGTNFGEL